MKNGNAFKPIEGHPTLIRATAVSASQYALVLEIIRWNKGETKIRRKDLQAAHVALRGKLWSPYFIVKNLACQVKGEHGLYNLGVLKSRAVKAPKAEVDPNTAVPKVKKAPRKPKAAIAETTSTEVAVAA